MISTIVITLLAVSCIGQYYLTTKTPVKMEKEPMRWQEWLDFVNANINSAETEEQCVTLTSLISLFDRYFRGKVNNTDFEETIAKLWQRLDRRYKALESQWDDFPNEKSRMRIDNRGQIIIQ